MSTPSAIKFCNFIIVNLKIICFSTATAQLSLADPQIEQFCGLNPFLGIYLFMDGEEIGLDNNYAWIKVVFECPGSSGNTFT